MHVDVPHKRIGAPNDHFLRAACDQLARYGVAPRVIGGDGHLIADGAAGRIARSALESRSSGLRLPGNRQGVGPAHFGRVAVAERTHPAVQARSGAIGSIAPAAAPAFWRANQIGW